MLLGGKHGILKERTGALAVGITGNDEHAFDGADMPDGLASLGEIGCRLATLEMTLEIGIADAGFAAGSEGVGDAENDEAAALSRVEDAGAVVESTGLRAEFAHLIIFQIEDED